LPDIETIIGQLNRARAGLEAAAEALPAARWQEAPRSGAWSAAEVIAHLTMVEERITGGASKLVQGGAPQVSLWRRLHLPPQLAEWRGFRAKTPIPLDRDLLGEKGAMLERLAAARQRTMELLQRNRERNLRAYRWRHPFFGSLNYYQWFRMIAHHEVRHTRQLREIAKVLGSST
jgi:hypothetical protein